MSSERLTEEQIARIDGWLADNAEMVMEQAREQIEWEINGALANEAPLSDEELEAMLADSMGFEPDYSAVPRVAAGVKAWHAQADREARKRIREAGKEK